MEIVKVNIKSYLKFSLSIIVLAIILYFLFDFFGLSYFNHNLQRGDIIHSRNPSILYSLEIIKNNTINFFQYFFLFPLSPLLIFIDLTITIYQLWVSIHLRGLVPTFLLLYKHAFIEFPNMLLYMYLSWVNMIILFKSFNLKNVFFSIKKNIKLYLLCIINILIAGLIEGALN